MKKNLKILIKWLLIWQYASNITFCSIFPLSSTPKIDNNSINSDENNIIVLKPSLQKKYFAVSKNNIIDSACQLLYNNIRLIYSINTIICTRDVLCNKTTINKIETGNKIITNALQSSNLITGYTEESHRICLNIKKLLKLLKIHPNNDVLIEIYDILFINTNKNLTIKCEIYSLEKSHKKIKKKERNLILKEPTPFRFSESINLTQHRGTSHYISIIGKEFFDSDSSSEYEIPKIPKEISEENEENDYNDIKRENTIIFTFSITAFVLFAIIAIVSVLRKRRIR
ncbi:hypothetical protein NUSPORA_01173 [Nucleospora cyclopteri]